MVRCLVLSCVLVVAGCHPSWEDRVTPGLPQCTATMNAMRTLPGHPGGHHSRTRQRRYYLMVVCWDWAVWMVLVCFKLSWLQRATSSENDPEDWQGKGSFGGSRESSDPASWRPILLYIYIYIYIPTMYFFCARQFIFIYLAFFFLAAQ